MAQQGSGADSGSVEGVERRQVLRGVAFAGVTGLGVYGLAGCGGNDGGGGGGDGAPQDLAGESIASASEIPVGGGTVFKEQKVVVTQPSEGTFKAFSATCTHRGCTVETVEDDLIKCFCHGSRYGLQNAEVKAGPAPKPLPEYPVRVENGQVIVTSQGGGNGGTGGGDG